MPAGVRTYKPSGIKCYTKAKHPGKEVSCTHVNPAVERKELEEEKIGEEVRGGKKKKRKPAPASKIWSVTLTRCNELR
jgi:hypothetical protein